MDETEISWNEHGITSFPRNRGESPGFSFEPEACRLVKIPAKSALDKAFGETWVADKSNYPCHFEAKREICFSSPPADSGFLEAALLGMTRGEVRSMRSKWIANDKAEATE